MDELSEFFLLDVSHMTMLELAACDDPEVLAAMERLVQRVLEADPSDGGC